MEPRTWKTETFLQPWGRFFVDPSIISHFMSLRILIHPFRLLGPAVQTDEFHSSRKRSREIPQIQGDLPFLRVPCAHSYPDSCVAVLSHGRALQQLKLLQPGELIFSA